MKKEKKVRTYQRRTKSGKMVTVKAHTAKYDAAEHAKELAKKKGAGEELEERKKKKKTPSLELPLDKDSKEEIVEEVKEIAKKGVEKSTKKSSEGKSTKEAKSNAKTKAESKSKKAETSGPAFTAAEFKEWYEGTGSAVDKKVAKALRAQLGRSGYYKLEDEAIDNYTPRGYLSMFKRVSADGGKSLHKTKAASASKKESVYEKYGTTHKEVVAYMKASPRKWKWDASDKVFYTSRMPDGGTAKSPYKTSLESAIKRMQKAQGKSTNMSGRQYEPGVVFDGKKVTLFSGNTYDTAMRSIRRGRTLSPTMMEAIANFERETGRTPSNLKAEASKSRKNRSGQGVRTTVHGNVPYKRRSAPALKAKRMKPSEVEEITTKRDWIYND